MHIFFVNPNTNPQKGQVDTMDDGKKKIWICLLVVVLAAVVIGVLYYFSVPSENGSEGFLIRTSYRQYGHEIQQTVSETEGETSPERNCRGVTLLSEEESADGI